jgi:hypothetical protein
MGQPLSLSKTVKVEMSVSGGLADDRIDNGLLVCNPDDFIR